MIIGPPVVGERSETYSQPNLLPPRQPGANEGTPPAKESYADSSFKAAPEPRDDRGLTTGYTRERASQDANELYRAMLGNTGIGADKDAIFSTLQGRSPADIELIRKDFKEHYGRDLDDLIGQKLTGDDLVHAKSLMSGDKAKASAAAIYRQTGFFGDHDAILNKLRGADPQQRSAIARDFQEAYAKDYPGVRASSPEEFMQKALGPRLDDSEKSQLRSLLSTTSAKPEEVSRLEASAAREQVSSSLKGFWGADSQKVFEGLEKLPDDQKRMLRGDPGLMDELKGKLGNEDFNRAKAILEKDSAGASAAQIDRATHGWLGADKQSVLGVLKNTKPEALPALKEAYQKQTGKSLEETVRGWGGSDAEVGLGYLNPPGEEDSAGQAKAAAQRLNHAMDSMVSSDKAELREVLGDKSKAQIDRITAAYKELYKRDLRADLEANTSGRNRFEIVEQMYDKGAIDPKAPDAAQQKIQRLREAQKFEANSWGTGVVDAVQTWSRTSGGVQGESDSARLNRDLNEAQAALDAGDKATAMRKAGFAGADVKAVQESKDAVADMATTAAVTVGTTAAVVCTGGAATPLAIAGYATLGGGTRVAVQYAFKGDSMGREEFLREGATGAVEGATSVVPLGKGVRGAAAAEQAAQRTFAQRLGHATSEGAKIGAVSGSASGAVDEAMKGETWRNGGLEGLRRVGARGARDGAVGLATGVGTGAALHVAGAGVSKLAQPREVPIYRNPELHGNTTLVRYDAGRVRIEAGPTATAEHIRAHLQTARTLQKYEGPLGQIRKLRDRADQAIRGRPGYGSQGFESQLEVKKLRGIRGDLETMKQGIDERIRTLGPKVDAETVQARAEVEKEIASIHRQLAQHEAQVTSLEGSRGFVAAMDKEVSGDAAGALSKKWAQSPVADQLQKIDKALDGLPQKAAHYRNVLAEAEAAGLPGMRVWIGEAAGKAGNAKSLESWMAKLENELQASKAGAKASLAIFPKGEGVVQGQFEKLLDDNGFKRYTHPGSGNAIREPGFGAGGVPLNRGKQAPVREAGTTYPDAYGYDRRTNQMIASELKTPGADGQPTSVGAFFRKIDGSLKEELKNRLTCLPRDQKQIDEIATRLMGQPVQGAKPVQQLVVDLRWTGQSSEQALKELGESMHKDVKGMFDGGVRFVTGTAAHPVFEAPVKIP